MKRIFTLLAGAFLVTMAMAQAPEAVIQKATVAPIIDGTVDDIWETVEPNLIDQPYTNETPTVGESGETWWKALWDDNGVYILVTVNDDIFAPAYGAADEWKYDKVEVYFDANFNHMDGLGPQTDANGGGNGHYQFAPSPVKDSISGGEASSKGANGSRFSYNVTDPNYLVEYFIPFTKLLDGDGTMVDKSSPIGFDISISDNDIAAPGAVRHRMVWANVGAKAENWVNMDDAGTITLEGAEPGIEITALAITGGTEITTDNGTIQFTAEVTPTDATQGYKWVLTNETGLATITDGLLAALRNGTVKVKAVSSDDFVESNEITITISGQRVSLEEINIIKNSYFDKGTDGKENWGGAGVVDAEGYYSLVCVPDTFIYDKMFGQPNIPVADATTKYIVRFKAKGSADMVVPTLFEDRGNGNNKVVITTAPYRDNTYGKWDVPVTTEAQWFEFDVIFSQFKANSAYELNFQAGLVDGTFSVDSIMMFSEADLALVSTSSRRVSASSIKVYPNPVGAGNDLYVSLTTAKGKIAIYNALGQKLMEKVVTGNLIKFDVSSLRQGIYFVKLSDGSVQKFIR